MCQHCNTYKYLEPRPKNWRNQLWIKGRNMTVWHLIATMRIEPETLEQTAENFGLPVEVVVEATHYYALHKDIVEADVDAEKRILIEEFGEAVESLCLLLFTLMIVLTITVSCSHADGIAVCNPTPVHNN